MKAELKEAEEELAAAEAARDAALALVPNPPHESAPDGDTEDDAEELRRVGEPTVLASRASTRRSAASTWSGPRASRARGSATSSATRRASRWRCTSSRSTHLAEAGFTPVIPPVLVREEAMYGTGFFPTERSNIYALEADGLYLTGTSEVALAALHMGEILDELPLRYTGFSTCFRREAGAAGKDTRGMFRVHQFNKVEMFVFVEPETSWDEHERMLELEERFMQALGLPYRVMNVAAGDLGAPAAKKYDIEAWFPFQERYREVTSCSNTTDYQARRLGIRYRTRRRSSSTRTR